MKNTRKNNAIVKAFKSKAKENNAIVKALKEVPEMQWVGSIVYDTMDKCLASINLGTLNSGWYNAIAIKIDGLTGWFMVNQSGSIFFEARIIKEDEKKYRVEYMTNSAFKEFENNYRKFSEECE
jgi:hypothetical protein